MTANRRFTSITLLIYLIFSTALPGSCRESEEERAVELQKIKSLTEQIKLEPGRSFLYASRGQCFVGLEDWDRALVDTNTAVYINSTNSSYRRARAYIYNALNKQDLRKKDLEEAVRLKPTDPENLKALAGCFFSEKNYSAACVYFSRAIDLQPNSAELHILRAEMLNLQGKYSDAIADCDAAFKIEPGYKKAIMVMGEIKAAQDSSRRK